MHGLVTRPRRPPGWEAPGPPPAAPRHRPEAWPGPGEELCLLTGDWRLLQKVHGHRWSLDDLVTAWVATEEVAAPERVVDLGCGIGAVLLMLAWRFPEARCTGIEAQEASAALARRSVLWNGVEERVDVHVGDIRNGVAPKLVADLVTGTPPYLPPGTATEPTRDEQAGSHVELRGGIEDYCRAAARRLAPGGVFVVCHAAPQRPRAERAAAEAGLAIRRRLDVEPREGKPPLFSVYVMALGDERFEATESRLVVRDARGAWTEGFLAVRAAMGMPPAPAEASP